MSTLRDIRKRVHSVENIKQITRAMEMIAATRLRQAQLKAERSRPYANLTQELLKNLSALSENIPHPLFQKRPVKKTGIIIITADKGLCGSYNMALLSAADRFLKKYSPNHAELVLIGQKGIQHYRKKPWTIKEEMIDWGGKITLKEIQPLAQKLIDLYVSNQWDEIYLIYTHYINIMSRKITLEKFFPIEAATQNPSHSINYITEPGPIQILELLMPRYCTSKIGSILDDSYASELSSRVVSMKTATKNAEKMIESLTLLKNKIRQTGITREMLEIVSGSESHHH